MSARHTTFAPSAPRTGVVLDNRLSYLSFGLTWLVAYGAYALSHGADPILSMPSVVPVVLLIAGLLASIVVTSVVTARAQKGASHHDSVTGNLLAASWVVGFGALCLIIIALSEVLDEQYVHTVMWPTGSALIVGMIYLAGGAVYRDVVQYVLGSWLALSSSAALFFDIPALYWVLSLAGGGAYFVAAVLEPRRRATAALR